MSLPILFHTYDEFLALLKEKLGGRLMSHYGATVRMPVIETRRKAVNGQTYEQQCYYCPLEVVYEHRNAWVDTLEHPDTDYQEMCREIIRAADKSHFGYSSSLREALEALTEGDNT